MSLRDWMKKHAKPKRAELQNQLTAWVEETLPTEGELATLTAKDHAGWISALEQAQSIFRRAKKESGEDIPKSLTGKGGKSVVSRPAFVGQSEIGPPNLAEQVPDFPYWEEMLRLGTKRLPDSRRVPPLGALSLDSVSARDFARGGVGSAFAGLIQIADRTAEAADRLFLVPLFQEDAELSAIKFQRPRASYRAARGKLLSPHASALQGLIKERGLLRKPWAGFDPDLLRAEETHHEAGCFLGFFLVKGESAEVSAAYINFTCASLNRYATGVYDQTPQLAQPGGPEVPLSLAKRAYSVLSKLT